MKPIGPLMWEHRLIEKMTRLFNDEIVRIKKQTKVNTVLSPLPLISSEPTQIEPITVKKKISFSETLLQRISHRNIKGS